METRKQNGERKSGKTKDVVHGLLDRRKPLPVWIGSEPHFTGFCFAVFPFAVLPLVLDPLAPIQVLKPRPLLDIGELDRIGRAVALKLAGAGCDVAITYHTGADEAEVVCAEIQALGRRALALQTAGTKAVYGLTAARANFVSLAA